MFDLSTSESFLLFVSKTTNPSYQLDWKTNWTERDLCRQEECAFYGVSETRDLYKFIAEQATP
jgi:hypothetical protein